MFIIPFKQIEIADEIKKILAEIGAFYNCDDLSWQNLDSDSWTIEFNVGDDAETECSTGEFIAPGKPTSYERWKAYRDKIVNGQ